MVTFKGFEAKSRPERHDNGRFLLRGTWIACERAKALQLGLPVGQRALVPMPLLHSAGTSEVAALGAAFAVTEAGQRLLDLERIYDAIDGLLPAEPQAWRDLMPSCHACLSRLCNAIYR